MIEDPKKEELNQEEELEIEIDEEGHTESPAEEQPAPEPETPETEKEEEEVDEEPEKEEEPAETETESEEEESDDKKVYGKRAEKRIKRLVKQRKELQEKLEALEAEKQKFQQEREELSSRTAESELEAVKQYGNRLKAQEKEVLATLREGKPLNIDPERKFIFQGLKPEDDERYRMLLKMDYDENEAKNIYYQFWCNNLLYRQHSS